MKIITESIKEDLEVQLNKQIEEILPEELLQIKNITINRLGFGDEILKINYDEILYFSNLEELTIFNCMINNELMDNILKLNNLKILKIYNSDFIDLPNYIFDNLKINELTISNSLGLKDIKLEGLMYLELKNIKMDFSISDIGILNISNVNTKINISKLKNIKKVIISEKDYYKEKILSSMNSNIIVVDDRLEIIKEIKNDKN